MALDKAVSLTGDGQQESFVATMRSAEIDFGPASRRDATFTVGDADVTPTTLVMVNHSAAAATGRAQDENEMDTLLLRAVAGVGQFTLYATAFPTLVSGKFRINYLLR